VIEVWRKPIRVLIFPPIPVLVSVLEAHPFERWMVTFLFACIPRRLFPGLGFTAIRVVTSLVFWDMQSAPISRPLLASEELLTASAFADRRDSNVSLPHCNSPSAINGMSLAYHTGKVL
jgi:hypothetical protein